MEDFDRMRSLYRRYLSVPPDDGREALWQRILAELERREQERREAAE